ncbi:MAG: hypothetical protein JXA06_10515 [Bacteroidetes bacterium]|nr:hypothetical protein [Bacteroidota bacterium]
MKYSILICSIFIMSCSVQKSIISNFNAEGFDITSLKGSSIRLYVNPEISSSEFEKVFNSEYPSNIIFFSSLGSKIKNMLESYSIVVIDANAYTDNYFTNQSNPNDNAARINELLTKTNESYLLRIKKVEISRSVDQTPQNLLANAPVSAPSRGRSSSSSASTKDIQRADKCTAKISAEVWSVKEKKKVAEFASIGQTEIILLMHGRALNEALENSVSNMADYITEKKE